MRLRWWLALVLFAQAVSRVDREAQEEGALSTQAQAVVRELKEQIQDEENANADFTTSPPNLFPSTTAPPSQQVRGPGGVPVPPAIPKAAPVFQVVLQPPDTVGGKPHFEISLGPGKQQPAAPAPLDPWRSITPEFRKCLYPPCPLNARVPKGKLVSPVLPPQPCGNFDPCFPHEVPPTCVLEKPCIVKPEQEPPPIPFLTPTTPFRWCQPPNVMAQCCGNGICEYPETAQNCPADCGQGNTFQPSVPSGQALTPEEEDSLLPANGGSGRLPNNKNNDNGVANDVKQLMDALLRSSRGRRNTGAQGLLAPMVRGTPTRGRSIPSDYVGISPLALPGGSLSAPNDFSMVPSNFGSQINLSPFLSNPPQSGSIRRPNMRVGVQSPSYTSSPVARSYSTF